MQGKVDSAGNTYFDVGNIRITAIPSTWDQGRPGLRVQAYKGVGDALNPGAEIPVPDKKVAMISFGL
jgi:hypothetical protein